MYRKNQFFCRKTDKPKGNLFKCFVYLVLLQFQEYWRNTMEYTRYEKARIIGARALQLSMGAPSTLVKLPKDLIDPVSIAMLEFNEGAIPITVRRKKE